jgi:hypothetical protein
MRQVSYISLVIKYWESEEEQVDPQVDTQQAPQVW